MDYDALRCAGFTAEDEVVMDLPVLSSDDEENNIGNEDNFQASGSAGLR